MFCNVYLPFVYSLHHGPVAVPQQCASEWERLSSKWLHVEEELLRERAVFGPGAGVLLSRNWVQDAAEGPNRTRPRIRRKGLMWSKRVWPFRSQHLPSSAIIIKLVFFSVEPHLKDVILVTTGARNPVFEGWHV